MRVRFMLAEGIASIRRVAVASSVGSILTGVALAILGGLALLAFAYRNDLAQARASVGAEVFLADWVDQQRGEAIARELEAFPEIRSARLRSATEITELIGLEGDPVIPLPRMIRIELENGSGGRNATGPTTRGIANRLEAMSGVEEVAFPDVLVRTVDERSEIFFKVVFVVGVALALSVIGIVANTAHATVLARRPVIRTMRLLGAERRWILAPFLIQGSMIGLLGGLLAAGALYATWYLFPGLSTYFSQREFAMSLIAFPAAGGALAGIGALIASLYYVRKV